MIPAASNFGAIERGGASPSISDTWPYHEQFRAALVEADKLTLQLQELTQQELTQQLKRESK